MKTVLRLFSKKLGCCEFGEVRWYSSDLRSAMGSWASHVDCLVPNVVFSMIYNHLPLFIHGTIGRTGKAWFRSVVSSPSARVPKGSVQLGD